MSEKKRATYQAFLLRLWSEDSDTAWRLTLEQAQSGERRHFASVQQLGAYLERLIEDGLDSAAVPDPSRSRRGRAGDE